MIIRGVRRNYGIHILHESTYDNWPGRSTSGLLVIWRMGVVHRMGLPTLAGVEVWEVYNLGRHELFSKHSLVEYRERIIA